MTASDNTPTASTGGQPEPKATKKTAADAGPLEHRFSRRNLLRYGTVAAGATLIGGGAGYETAHWLRRNRTKPEKLWKLATVVPKDAAHIGEGQEIARGLELAIRVMNSRGGVAGRDVDLAVEEVEDLSPAALSAAATALVAKEPTAVFLGFTSPQASELQTYADYGAPVFHLSPSQAAAAFSTAEESAIFRALPRGTYGPAFAGLLRDLTTSGGLAGVPQTCAVIAQDGEDGAALAAAVEGSLQGTGWTIVPRITAKGVGGDMKALAAQVASAGPGAIFVGLESPKDAAIFQEEFGKQPSRTLVYLAFTPSVPEYLARAGEAADGVIWSTPVGTITGSPTAARFEELFAKKNAKAKLGLSQCGAMYDLALFWSQCAALAKRPSKFSSVSGLISDVVYRGVSGTFNFGDDRTTVAYPSGTSDPGLGLPHLTFQIQGGKQVRLAPDMYRNGQFVRPAWL